MFTILVQIILYVSSSYMLRLISNMPVKISSTSKPTANVRVRRSSSSSRKRRNKHRDKDTDTASIITSSTNSTDLFESEARCPMRFFLNMLSPHRHHESGKKQCPLRHAHLWHTIPLCLLAVVNLLLVAIALLGLAGVRAIVQVSAVVEGFVKMQVGSPSKDVVVGDMSGKPMRGKDYLGSH